MIRYVPSSQAAPLTEALYRLSRTQGGDVTTALFGYVDALDASRWLVVDTELEIPVHADAELDGIAGILQPWIDDGSLPANTNAQLAALIESKRGSRLVVYAAFPQLFKDLSKSHAEMIAAGLLASSPCPH